MPRKPRGRLIVVGAVAAAALIVGIGALMHGGHRAPDPSAASQPPDPSPSTPPAADDGNGSDEGTASPAVAPAAATTHTPAPSPASTVHVHVRIHTSPADAHLTMDGARVDNPFDGRPVESSAHHVFEAQADGYRTGSLGVTFATNHDEMIRLARAQGTHAHHAAHAHAHAHAHHATQTHHAGHSHHGGHAHSAGFVTENPY